MSIKGAEFRNCDFQIHSPRDENWNGKRPEDGINASDTEARAKARNSYCHDFINRCVAEKLQAVAIADHHEGVYAYCMLSAKQEMEAEGEQVDLWIFPAMELTCKDSSQALLVFDSDFTQPHFEKARAKLGLPSETNPTDSKGIKVELLTYNISDLQKLLEEDPELNGRFIILPHVKPKGHKTVLRDGFHKRFNEMPYVGGYMDQCYPDDLSDADRRILDGKIPAWSSEKRGVICTSDARHADFHLIGHYSTWIKLASPTAESMRQAMLAPDCRLRYKEPDLPSVVISEMVVRGSKYLQNGHFHFNSQMNSVIGGRGAGKSTLLEYIRFALGCSALDRSSEQDATSERLKELLLSTLDQETGVIELTVLLNGAPIILKRAINSKAIINITTNNSSKNSPVEDVRSLVPTQQYRQGELSELGHDDAYKRLMGLVTAQAFKEIASIEEQLKKNGQAISETLSHAIRLHQAKQARSLAETETNLLKLQIEKLSEEFNASGQPLSPAIDVHSNYIKQDESITRVTQRLSEIHSQMDSIFAECKNEIKSLAIDQPVVSDVAALKDAYAKLRSGIQDDVSQGALIQAQNISNEWFKDAIQDVRLAALTWKPILKNHQQKYDEEKSALEGKQSVLESLDDLKAKWTQASLSVQTSHDEETSLADSDIILTRLRSTRSDLQNKLKDLVSTQLSTIETSSSRLARGRLSEKLDFTEAQGAINNILNIPLLRDSRKESLFETVTGDPNSVEKWTELVDEFINLLKWKEGGVVQQVTSPKTPLLQNALGDNFMERLKEHINTNQVSEILSVVLRPRAEIFQLRDDIEIEFRKASQGEQAATLLNILMNQSSGPLIIDQPEEDLDNRIINDIILTIRKTKDVRQLILATHNANITVNGDSENVIEMVLGHKRAVGAIDEPDVSEAITNTMEGGKDAFELRRKKYNY